VVYYLRKKLDKPGKLLLPFLSTLASAVTFITILSTGSDVILVGKQSRTIFFLNVIGGYSDASSWQHLEASACVNGEGNSRTDRTNVLLYISFALLGTSRCVE
jgi:hypothetical protein